MHGISGPLLMLVCGRKVNTTGCDCILVLRAVHAKTNTKIFLALSLRTQRYHVIDNLTYTAYFSLSLLPPYSSDISPAGVVGIPIWPQFEGIVFC